LRRSAKFEIQNDIGPGNTINFGIIADLRLYSDKMD